MSPAEIDQFLGRSLDDRRLSRGERQALVEGLKGIERTEDRAALRRRAFELAAATLADPNDRLVLEWLDDVTKALHRDTPPTASPEVSEAHFSPGDDCPRRIIQLLNHARDAVDLCVFTITDDRISRAILDAHRRRVALRIVTDNEKASDLGSDIDRFQAAGIAVRVDRTEYHMHHKFALFDGRTLLTGSYNWTRGAAVSNEENFIITTDRRLVGSFRDAFEGLWERLA